MTAQSLTEMRRLLDKYGLAPIKSLGQHFLADPNLTRRVVAAAAVEPGDQVLEVGAGTGTLTRALTEAGARVLALEVDQRLRPVLEEALTGIAVDLRLVDALDFDYATELGGGPWKMVSNLPYEIGTVLLLDLVRHVPVIETFIVMVQQEVARRITAAPGSHEYGLPSVVTGLHGQSRLLFTVPPQVFFPPPRVESAVVQIVRKPTVAGTDRAIELATAAFGQRRKMLRSSLRGVLDDAEASLAEAGIEPTLRPESLAPGDFLRLAQAAP